MNRRTLFLATAALHGPSPVALAHARLRSASPEPGDMPSAAPKQGSTTFSEALEPKLSSIEMRNAAGARFDHGAARRGADAKILAVSLNPLPPGDYTVSWHATSVDTHTAEGAFSFMLHG